MSLNIFSTTLTWILLSTSAYLLLSFKHLPINTRKTLISGPMGILFISVFSTLFNLNTDLLVFLSVLVWSVFVYIYERKHIIGNGLSIKPRTFSNLQLNLVTIIVVQIILVVLLESVQ
jgi:hypothetical protein